jgi:hypothetical protein
VYSFISNINYENKTIDVTENLGKDFSKGTYYVNIFEKNQLFQKSFTLK